MTTKHEIKVSITPLCASCGGELTVGGTESKPTNHPFERDDPWNRVDQRVFIYHCPKCFLHKTDYYNLLMACRQAKEWLEGWASAEPQLAVIRAAIAKAEAQS